MNLGIQELLVIFIIALLVFGPKRLPELGKSLGKGIRDFKKALNTDDPEETPKLPNATASRELPSAFPQKTTTEV